MSDGRIGTYSELAKAMRELAQLRERHRLAVIDAKNAIQQRDSLEQQCETLAKRVLEGMETCDVKSDGNYGWSARFLRFMDCLLQEAKERG